MFNLVKKVSNYATNKEFLEGLAAALGLTAAADGNVTPDEVVAALAGAKQNKRIIEAGVPERDLETHLHAALDRAKSFSGRLTLIRDLQDVAERDKTGQMGEDIVACAIDVAGADGDIGEKELAVLRTIAGKLSVDLKQFGL